ncbi:hypothetical protein LB464_22850 [Escherichia coli]|uniref:hypothetical protein n=1 Tax=Escherichia coli TaxID=562 RepID=UPI00226ECFBB|nr:hypothetical protein [Escherichia coli]MCY0205156.1 hypothetical protein [Escherichia coli]
MTHDQHIIGHFCHHSHIVGDQQQAGGKRLLQFAHQLEDLRLNSDVEGRGRLIGNQHLWWHSIAMAIITRWRIPPESSCDTVAGASPHD